ncbi:MAG: Ig-like domain-containing protein, partial [Chitinophagales bacterium]
MRFNTKNRIIRKKAGVILLALLMVCSSLVISVPPSNAAEQDLTSWIIGGQECAGIANAHVNITAGTTIADLQQHAEDTLPVPTVGAVAYYDSFVGLKGISWKPTSGLRNEIRLAKWDSTADNGDGTFGAYVQSTYTGGNKPDIVLSEDDAVIHVWANGWTKGNFLFHKIKLLSPTKLGAFTIGGTDCRSLTGVEVAADRTDWANALTQTGAELEVSDFNSFKGLTATPHGPAGVCIAKLYRNGSYVADVTNNSPKSILDDTKGNAHPWPKISNPENPQQIWYTSNENQTFQANDVIVMRWYDGPVHQFYKVTLKSEAPVNVPVTGVVVDTTSLNLIEGESSTLTATVSPDNATNKAVTWSSNNEAAATVDQAGKVTAVAAGTATITVKTEDGSFTANCAVTVTKAVVNVTGITVAPTSLTLNAGETGQLTATVSPDNATNKAVTWSSSDSAIASVGQNGVVTANAEGNATITVTTQDGGKTATCAVTVNKVVVNVPVTAVSLDQPEMSLKTGSTGTLAATVEPDNATNKAVTWSSSDTSIVTVADGVLTAVAVGTATITATTVDGGFAATCVVSVKDAPVLTSFTVDGIECLSLPNLTVDMGADYMNYDAIMAELAKPENGAKLEIADFSTARNVVISKNYEPGVTVWALYKMTEEGPVEIPVGDWTNVMIEPDQAIIVALVEPYVAGNFYKLFLVKQTIVAVTGVSLDNVSMTLEEGQSGTLTATVAPDNATNKAVAWSSSNEAVATVSNGFVSAVASGTATITVTTADGGFIANCEVTVTPPIISVTGVSLDKESMTLLAGQTGTLAATIAPDNATNKVVVWSSSNTAVATVNNGEVTAVSGGTAVITVKAEDGGFTDTCNVTVNVPVTGVTLDKASMTLAAGQTGKLTATVAPADATNKTVTWSSSNTAAATVNNGVVTAVAAGNTTITVKTEDGGFTADCAVTVSQDTGADLALKITYYPKQVTPKYGIPVIVNVTNVGTQASSKATVDFYLDSSNKPCYSRQIGPLQTKKSKSIGVRIPIDSIPANAKITLSAVVKADVPDANQDNNT